MPQLWQSVKCQRPEVAADWSKTSRAQRDIALQLVSILSSLENLKTFKYHANIDPMQRSVRDRGSAFDWIFTSLISTLAARKYGHGFLYSLEEMDITGLSPPNKAIFLRVFFKLPKLRCLSLRPASHLQTQSHYLPAGLSQTIRELRITSPISLDNFPSLLGAVEKLEVLHIDICPSAFAFSSAYTAFKDALGTQHTHLRELYISSRTPCIAHFLGNNRRPWSFWTCTSLRTLSIPAELYNHYKANITRATHFLIPPHVEILMLSEWRFKQLQARDLDFLTRDTAVCLQLQKVVLHDLIGSHHAHIYQFRNARQAFRRRNPAPLFIEPTDFYFFSKTKEPAPDLLGIVPRRSIRIWYPREHSTALQLVYILHHLHHLKYFRFLSADSQGSRFQDTFISFFNRRAAQETVTETETEAGAEVRPLLLLSSVEEVDLSRIWYPNEGSFLRVLLYRPNIQSLSITETTPVLKMYFGPQLGSNTSPIRKLTLCNLTTLADASMLVRLPTSLEVLRPIEYALQTQATNLKELHITAHSSTVPDPFPNWGLQFRPYILSKYPNLRTLSIPDFLYTHTYRKLGTSNVLPTLLSPEIRTLALSTWFFSKITPDMIATIAVASGEVAPNLDRIVIKDMRGSNAERMVQKFAAAEDVCFMRGVALEYQDVSAFAKEAWIRGVGCVREYNGTEYPWLVLVLYGEAGRDLLDEKTFVKLSGSGTDGYGMMMVMVVMVVMKWLDC
ncbi:hypothetical protein BJX65DRAFT_302065 [Aspergillus insuetus]